MKRIRPFAAKNLDGVNKIKNKNRYKELIFR